MVRQGAMVFVLATAAPLLSAGAALAGCPNRCELTVDQPMIEPALACATWSTLPQDCDCAVLLDVRNDCATTVEAVDFSFTTCATPGTNASDCNVLEPQARGSLFLKLRDVGSHRFSLHARSGDAEHTVAFAANVTSFPSSGGCGCATTHGTRPISAGSLALVLASVVRRRRRPS